MTVPTVPARLGEQLEHLAGLNDDPGAGAITRDCGVRVLGAALRRLACST